MNQGNAKRIAELAKKFQTMKGFSKKNLIQYFGVSDKTIERDFKVLRDDYAYPLVYDPFSELYRLEYRMVSVKMPDAFPEADIGNLTAAMKLLQNDYEHPFSNSFDRLSDLLENHLVQSEDRQFIKKIVSISPIQVPFNLKIWSVVRKALTACQTVELEYSSPTSRKAIRFNLDPYYMINHESRWYVIGYHHQKAEYRTFALQRLKKTVLTNRSFLMRSDFNLNDFMDPELGLTGGGEPVQIRIEFDFESASYMQELYWHRTQKWCEWEEGYWHLTLETNQPYDVLYRLLSYAPGGEILEPDFLRSEMEEKVLALSNIYLKKE